MGIITNKNHFLHKYLKFIESIEIEGKNGGFELYLNNLNISISGQNWDEDHSTIDWKKHSKFYSFYFDYEGNEEITDWLKKSKLSEYDYIYTWLDWNDPIIKIKTIDFFENWEWIYIASIEGMILTTFDGNFYLEFTDDYKYNLNSNFEIKPNSLINN